MIRVITIDREYGSGAADIAATLAARFGWKLLGLAAYHRERPHYGLRLAAVESRRNWHARLSAPTRRVRLHNAYLDRTRFDSTHPVRAII
jgi:hypothetical protein